MIVVENRATQETFQSLNLKFFRSQKYKKRVSKNDRKNLPRDFEKCPGLLFSTTHAHYKCPPKNDCVRYTTYCLA